MVNPPNTFLTDSPGALLPTLPSDIDYLSYSAQLLAIEKLLNQLFTEVEAAESAGEYALSLGDSRLEPIAKSLQDIESQVDAGRAQADRLSAQALPITGGQYTHLVSETFRTNSVRDVVSDFQRQPLRLAQPNLVKFPGCPPRPDLEIDSALQVLRLKREGVAVAFEGVPNASVTQGGTLTIDRIFGTPVRPMTETDDGSWELSVGSRSPIAQGFALGNTGPTTWLPSTYESGGAVRLRVQLSNPSPITEIRLRGAMSLLNGQPTLLETIAAIDSRTDPTNAGGVPVRAVNTNGNFLGLTGWQNLNLNTTAPATGTGGPGGTHQATVYGQIGQLITGLRSGDHYVLRYDVASPWNDTTAPGANGGTTPVSPESTYVRVTYYASATPNVGIDSPLGVELFRDEYLHQGGLFAGWSRIRQILTLPAGTLSVHLVIGVDPYVSSGLTPSQSGAALAYANVWIADEAISRAWSQEVPTPAESNLSGPSTSTTTKSYTSEDSIDSLRVPLGNDSGSLVLSDVWVVLGQTSPTIADAGAWETLFNTSAALSPPLPAYRLSLPADTPKGRAARDPLLLHEARYVGSGPTEYDASTIRLGGERATIRVARHRVPISTRHGLPTSLLTRNGQRSATPRQSDRRTGGFWRDSGHWNKRAISIIPFLTQIQSRWSTVWSYLIALAKSNPQPVGSIHDLLQQNLQQPSTPETGSLYVYTMGLSSLTLLRQEYAPSGLYVTHPLKNIDNAPTNAIPGEIHEIAILTDPPLPTLGPRLRTWVIPDSGAQEDDAPTALLARGIPLDSQNPRATFHSTLEIRPGILPATSDVATSFGVPGPAFYITPSFHSQEIDGGLDPDSVINGLQLDYLPYINNEAIRNIVLAIAAGGQQNPTVYDPNAIRPVIDFLQTFDSGFVSSTNAAFGYDNKPHVTPGSTNTVALPFKNGLGNVVTFLPPYSTAINFISGPAGASFDSNATIIINADYSLSMNFVAPTIVGDYQVDVVVTIPASTITGAAAQSYTTHVLFNVKVPTVSSDTLSYVTGYRPIAVRIELPSGQVILPDSLGKPRPGEVIYEPLEILQESTSLQTQTLPSSSATYAYQTTDQTANANTILQVQQRSFVTANSPIAAGQTGTAIELFWHQSAEFDPASGGILTRFDVKIPPSDFTVDAHTGQVIVSSQPPYGWAAYDQVVASYFWRVGNIAPREWFPPPNLLDLQALTEITDPLNFTSNVQNIPLTAEKQVIGTGNATTGELVRDAAGNLLTALPVTAYPETAQTTTLLNTWKLNTTSGFASIGTMDHGLWGMPSPNPFSGNPWLFNDPTGTHSGLHIDIPYAGAGQYQYLLGLSAWTSAGSSLFVTLSVWNTDPFSPVETTSTIEYVTVAPTSSTSTTDGIIPFSTDSLNLTKSSFPQGYPATGQVQQYFLSNTIFGTGNPIPGPFEFITDATTGTYYMRLEISLGNLVSGGSELTTGVALGYASLEGLVTTQILGYPAGYDSNGNLIPQPVFTAVTTDVTGGVSAATVLPAPTSVADLLTGPIQQSYPVTRNVTNYAGDMPAPLQAPNWDYMSPDYYPVIEYRVDPGGRFRFATDFSETGLFAGSKFLFEYQYLDVNPRIALEILPSGQDQFSNPGLMTNANDLRPQTNTPEISSLHLLINARY